MPTLKVTYYGTATLSLSRTQLLVCGDTGRKGQEKLPVPMNVSPQLILASVSIVMSLRYLIEVSNVLSSWLLTFQVCGSTGEVDSRASYQGYVGV